MARRKAKQGTEKAPANGPDEQPHTRDSVGALVGNTLHPHKLDRLAEQLNRKRPQGEASTRALIVRVVPLLGGDEERREALVRGLCAPETN